MTLAGVKRKLHEYIDTADEKKLKAIYTLVQDDLEAKSEYDVVTLQGFRQTRDDYQKGVIQGITTHEALNNIRKNIKKGGV